MAATINTNINSLTAQRNLTSSQMSLSSSIQRLSSGLRINSAKDDAAGLAISERFTSQIRGSTQAARNANDGISLAQTGEGALSSMSTILQRVRELAVQSANATNSASDRKALQAETGQLLSELDRIATATQFNGQNILDGSLSQAVFQVGANANQTITATTGNFRTTTYGAQVFYSKLADASAAAKVDLSAGGNITLNAQKTVTVNIAATDSAKDIAATANAQTADSGVVASARTLAELKFTATGSFSLKMTGDSSTASNVSFNVGGNTAAGLAEAVKSINDVSASTGFTASLNAASNGIVLTNNTGSDLKVENSGAAGQTFKLAAFDAETTKASATLTFGTQTADIDGGGTNAAFASGSLEFTSEKGFSLTGTTISTAGAATLNKVSDIDISSVSGATLALKVADAAIAAVSSQRASFGALQSRFDSTVSSLNVATENLSASRSRIQDADFAVETANLSRAQILQQAGTAMVAQANQLPQGVLALLR